MDNNDTMIDMLQEQCIIDFNTRICLIQRVFEKQKFIGIEDKQLKRGNAMYYGETFDFLYDMTLEQLDKHERLVDGFTKTYSEWLKGIDHE